MVFISTCKIHGLSWVPSYFVGLHSQYSFPHCSSKANIVQDDVAVRGRCCDQRWLRWVVPHTVYTIATPFKLVNRLRAGVIPYLHIRVARGELWTLPAVIYGRKRRVSPPRFNSVGCGGRRRACRRSCYLERGVVHPPLLDQFIIATSKIKLAISRYSDASDKTLMDPAMPNRLLQGQVPDSNLSITCPRHKVGQAFGVDCRAPDAICMIIHCRHEWFGKHFL